MKTKKIILPFNETKLKNIKNGDFLEISGRILVCRDQVHSLINAMVKRKEKLPVDFTNQAIFYAGPSPTPPGKIIGSIGPTTSARMDVLTPVMLSLGVNCFIGKGPRSLEVMEQIKKNHAIYCVTFGGYAALLSSYVISNEIIAFEELGPESLLCIRVKDFPVVAVI